ncbi:hypothetical protein SAMN05216325_1576, partial [Nitrosomonas marina]
MSALPKEQEFKKPSRKPEYVFLRWNGKSFDPADATAERQLREKKLSVGQVVRAVIRKL